MNWFKQALATIYGKEGIKGAGIAVAIAIGAVGALVGIALWAGIDVGGLINSLPGL